MWLTQLWNTIQYNTTLDTPQCHFSPPTHFLCFFFVCLFVFLQKNFYSLSIFYAKHIWNKQTQLSTPADKTQGGKISGLLLGPLDPTIFDTILWIHGKRCLLEYLSIYLSNLIISEHTNQLLSATEKQQEQIHQNTQKVSKELFSRKKI